MPGRDGRAWESEGGSRTGRTRPRRLSLRLSRTPSKPSPTAWFLWIPVLFAGGILVISRFPTNPARRRPQLSSSPRSGSVLAVRGLGLGLVIGGSVLAFALGFATAKLRTEMARAPVLAKEMRGVAVKGWVELYEPRDKARARITLRVIALGELKPEETPYRVRVTLPAASGRAETGEAVALKATLRPPPEPILPHGFDFGRTAWFARLGATGYATGKFEQLERHRRARSLGICGFGR